MASPGPMTLEPDTIVLKPMNFALVVPHEKSEKMHNGQAKQAKEPDGFMAAGFSIAKEVEVGSLQHTSGLAPHRCEFRTGPSLH